MRPLLTQKQGLYAGIALLSAAGVVLQIVLTRLYSALFGHHLAFLAVSLSMFGIGLGGVLMYVAPAIARPPRLFARLSYLSGATAGAIAVAVLVVLHSKPVEALDLSALGKLAALYLASALPFVLIGLAVAAAIQHAAHDISRLYLFDLAGAAMGGPLAIAALRAGAPRACLILSLLAALACGIFALAARDADGPYARGERPPRDGAVLTVAVAALALLASDIASPWLKLPDLRWVPMDRVAFQKWNEMSLITVDRPEGGLAWMRMDGSAATAILEPTTVPPLHPDEMAYVLQADRGPVLVIGAGGGRDVRAALKAGQKDVYAAEINPIIVRDVMRGRYAEYSGHLYDRPEVHVAIADGRSFVRRSPIRFTNIVISLVDTWAAASVGALALSENSLYTVEAFRDFIEHLELDGTLTVNRWDREFDRLLALAAAGLVAAGASAPAQHLFACGHSNSTALLVKRTPLTEDEIARLREHCAKNRFYEVFAPDRPGTPLRAALASGRDPAVVAPKSPVDLSAPTDDRPFFFYTVPTRRLRNVLSDASALKNEQMGLLTLVGLLVMSTGVAIVFLLGPLFAKPVAILRAPDRAARVRGLLLFASIGAAFVAVELALVQQFVMFLGHPVYALSTVIVALLLSTGIGSMLTAKIERTAAQRAASVRAIALAALLVVYALGLPSLLRAGVSLPLGGRMLVTLVLLAPLGLLMGSQAPLGVRLLEERAPALVSWCWGLNGATSVVATAFATLGAMHFGFRALLFVAAGCYALAAAAAPPARALAGDPGLPAARSPA